MKVWEYLSRKEIPHLEMSRDGSATPGRRQGLCLFSVGARP